MCVSMSMKMSTDLHASTFIRRCLPPLCSSSCSCFCSCYIFLITKLLVRCLRLLLQQARRQAHTYPHIYTLVAFKWSVTWLRVHTHRHTHTHTHLQASVIYQFIHFGDFSCVWFVVFDVCCFMPRKLSVNYHQRSGVSKFVSLTRWNNKSHQPTCSNQLSMLTFIISWFLCCCWLLYFFAASKSCIVAVEIFCRCVFVNVMIYCFFTCGGNATGLITFH